jgi:hypothetical protein
VSGNVRVYNSLITKNTSHGGNGGGGAASSYLLNCTVAGNSAHTGGGVSGGSVYNSIVYYNSAATQPDLRNAWVAQSCVSGGFVYSAGNFTNAPGFINLAAEDYRLETNSPCINSGNNAYMTNSVDIENAPRIVNGTVDMGAYEFQGSGSMISYLWLQQYGLPTDGSVDFVDSDGDGHNTWQEWRADTVPTNALSVLRLQQPFIAGSGIVLRWDKVDTRKYWIERSTITNGLLNFTTIGTNLSLSSFMDGSYSTISGAFYRVGVEPQVYYP